MKRLFFLIFVLLTLFLAACRGEAAPTVETETPVPFTLTPDLCSEANLPAEVAKINKLMREFDDYSSLASNTPQQQLVVIIPELQRVLRDAEDQTVPPCLTGLKELQVSHMTVVVQTLLAFVGSSDASLVGEGINKARELHAQYDIEMARLLGVTLTVVTPVPSTPVVESTAMPVAMVTNPGANELNLRSAPDFTAAAASVLAVGGSAVAVGRTADNQWIQVQVPDEPEKTAWVYTTVVQLSVSIESLPVVTP